LGWALFKVETKEELANQLTRLPEGRVEVLEQHAIGHVHLLLAPSPTGKALGTAALKSGPRRPADQVVGEIVAGQPDLSKIRSRLESNWPAQTS
jgi:hypothetical protein